MNNISVRSLSRFMSQLSLVLSVGLFVGCVQRVTIPDHPAADAPLAERQAYVEEWGPTATTASTVVSKYTASTSTTGVILNNGARVVNPADLRPALASETPGAKAIERWEAKSAINDGIVLGSWGAAGLGGVGFLAALALAGDASAESSQLVVPVLAVSSGFLAASLAGSLAAIVFVRPQNEAEEAFLLYENSLKKTLKLDKPASASGVVPDVAPAPAEPTPAAPAPAAPTQAPPTAL